MKILAVIPARAGSRGIPNKNIRIINGKPLIAYAIENALNSNYITDIVITTDSQEIELIANYYGVRCIHRDSQLCGDSVTLDAVVYDACKGDEVDYVVTMQPTSPTLRYVTLDNAIRYAVEKQLDTLISVVNRPHLAWVEKDGHVVPDYKQRLNRQYMPKRYLETGAFLISRYQIVTEFTRIGEKVAVYEIDAREAIDVDDYFDLLCVEQVLKESKIAIVVNGNNQIGMGHICRMLEVADTLYCKPDFFFDNRVTDIKAFGHTTYSVTPFHDEKELTQMIKIGEYSIVLNDILDTSEKYISGLKNIRRNMKIVNFEDLGDGRKKADLVINALYQENIDKTNVLCGEKYYFAPKMFLIYKSIQIRECVGNIFVCFGGADPQNYTNKVLNIITKDEYLEKNFIIVLGRAKQGYEEIIQNYSQANIRILYDVNNMPELMHTCDLAITSRGRTCYELALLGIPTIAMAQNEREERHTFVCEENGFKYLGREVTETVLETALREMLYSPQKKRKEVQEKMLRCDLRKGRERIKSLLDSILL